MSSPAKIGTILCAVLFCLAQHTPTADGANILGLFTSHSPSHLIVHMSVARALAEAGHNITVVCSTKPKVTHESIKVIVIPPTAEQENIVNEQMTIMAGRKNSVFTTVTNLFGNLATIIDMQVEVLQDKRFTALYENPDTKFDLIIMGYFMNDYQVGVAAKFNCPIIINWMGPPMSVINDFVGNPAEMTYVPVMQGVTTKDKGVGFFKRLQNIISGILFKGLGCYINYTMEKFYIQLFPTDGKFPTFNEMKKNVLLVFVNHHFSEGPIRPNVPALVEIGGIQIKDKPDPLPQDINEFLNSSSKYGAILFSLGSNLKGSAIKPELVNIIFKTLSSLKQNVIWKWEKLDQTPGSSPNILYKNWMPQDDILAHPNLKLFITHAGKGGLVESQYHGVPMVAIPVFGDQNTNAAKMTSEGYGLHLDLLDLNEHDFGKTIKEVLENPTYAANVQKFSKLYRDRPLTARQTAVFWTEYVLRHHGAAHIQSPLVHLNGFQSNNLDIILVFCIALYILWRLTKLIFKFICAKLCKKTKAANEKGKKVKKQ